MARKLAKKSSHEDYFHGAVVAKGSRVYGAGYNHEYVHAEAMAIAASSKTEGCTIWSVRINKQGELRMAKPCEDCMELIREMGFRKLMYSNGEGRIITEVIGRPSLGRTINGDG